MVIYAILKVKTFMLFWASSLRCIVLDWDGCGRKEGWSMLRSVLAFRMNPRVALCLFIQWEPLSQWHSITSHITWLLSINVAGCCACLMTTVTKFLLIHCMKRSMMWWDTDKCIQAMIRKHGGSRPLGRCEHEDNIRMDLEETWCEQDFDLG